MVSALLADAWGPGTEIRGAEPIWGRTHVMRLRVTTDRSVVLKRRGERVGGFGAELAALEYLNAMPVPVAPRLVGADDQAGLLLMEDLGPGASLADALLAGDRERAQAGLVSYARALGAMHAWSMGRPGELARLRARYTPQAPLSPAWLRAELAERYPGLWQRVLARRAFMAEALGIRLKPEVLPLSNLAGYLPRLWLSPHLAMRRK